MKIKKTIIALLIIIVAFLTGCELEFAGVNYNCDDDGNCDITSADSSAETFSPGKWVFHKAVDLKEFYDKPMPFGEYVPKNTSTNGEKLPLIIWLHGAVGSSQNCNDQSDASSLEKHRFIKLVSNWESTGLKPISAVIMAPSHCDTEGWQGKKSINTVKAIIDYAEKYDNIDRNRVVLMGHSDGGSGVVYVSRNNQDLFAGLVVMSGFACFNYDHNYYKTIPLKGYMTSNPARATDPNGGGDGNTGMIGCFSEINRSSDLHIFPKNTTHDEVQEKAFTLDEDNDGVSDLIYWATLQYKN